MNARAEPVRVKVAEAPLGLVRYFRTLIRNPLETLPQIIFEKKLAHGYILGRGMTLVSDPELVRQILVEDVETFVKPDEMKAVLAALGDGILTAGGAKWRWQRRTAAPLFRPDQVSLFVPAMIETAEATAVRWRELPPGSRIDLDHEMMRITFDIIVETTLSGRSGINIDRVGRAITDYLDRTTWVLALAMLRAPAWAPFPGRARFRAARDYLRSSVESIVRERRAGGAPRDDLIQRLLAAEDAETGRRMDDAEITDNLLTFIAAGHETTALTLTWTFYLLSLHPEAEAGILAEIERVTGGGPLNAPHLGELAFTRQVLSEAMRLYPPAPMITRRVARDTRLGEQEVKVGEVVGIPIYAIHRHRALWDEPDAFRPERFEPEAARARHRFAYMPFGAGPRICIGMGFAMTEATAVLATLVRAFRLRLAEGHVPAPKMRVTLRPEGGMPMRLEPRDGPAGIPARRAA